MLDGAETNPLHLTAPYLELASPSSLDAPSQERQQNSVAWHLDLAHFWALVCAVRFKLGECLQAPSSSVAIDSESDLGAESLPLARYVMFTWCSCSTHGLPRGGHLVTSRCPMMLSFPVCLAFHAALGSIHASLQSSVETSHLPSQKRPADIPLSYPWHLCHPSFRLRTRPLELALWLCIAKVEAFQPTRRPHPPPPPRARPCMGTYSPSFVDPSARSHRSLGVSPPWPHSCPWAFS